MASVYLAGPIKGLVFQDCIGWRDYATQQLLQYGIQAISPMRDKKDWSLETRTVDEWYSILNSQRGIFTRDKHDVVHSDVVLANLLGAKQVSIGTMFEFSWANLLGKPIVTIIENSGNVHDHAFVREATSYRVETLDSGLAIVKSVLGR